MTRAELVSSESTTRRRCVFLVKRISPAGGGPCATDTLWLQSPSCRAAHVAGTRVCISVSGNHQPLGERKRYKPGKCDEIRSGVLCNHVRESREESIPRRINPRLVLCGQL